MKRYEFLTVLGVSAGTVIFAPFLASCSKDITATSDPIPSGASGVDFTLDLTLAANAPLLTNGGSLVKSGIIVAKTSGGVYVAVAAACTHEGANVVFDSANSKFHCPNHGSNFGTNGSLLNGPATTALKLYNTQLTGTSLRVFA